MIDFHLSFPLPQPWMNENFKTDKIGPINFLVGPNGSGKSRFANELVEHPENSRLLGTDRLSEMGGSRSLRSYLGDGFAGGFAKNYFDVLKTAGAEGSGIDTIVLLEERMDLRIQVEATLGDLAPENALDFE